MNVFQKINILTDLDVKNDIKSNKDFQSHFFGIKISLIWKVDDKYSHKVKRFEKFLTKLYPNFHFKDPNI